MRRITNTFEKVPRAYRDTYPKQQKNRQAESCDRFACPGKQAANLTVTIFVSGNLTVKLTTT